MTLQVSYCIRNDSGLLWLLDGVKLLRYPVWLGRVRFLHRNRPAALRERIELRLYCRCWSAGAHLVNLVHVYAPPLVHREVGEDDVD